MEAMISGVPVVTTRYSGQEEFVTKRNSFVIDHTIVDVPEAVCLFIFIYFYFYFYEWY